MHGKIRADDTLKNAKLISLLIHCDKIHETHFQKKIAKT